MYRIMLGEEDIPIKDNARTYSGKVLQTSISYLNKDKTR